MAKNLSEVKENLSEKIKDLNKNSSVAKKDRLYESYVASLNHLMNLTDIQYKKDKFGLDKKLNAETLINFKLAYAKSGKAGEELLKNMSKYKGTPAYETILSIQKLLADDFKVLNAVDTASLSSGTVSLQKIMSDSKLKTVDLTGKNFGSVGAAQSSRIPFNYVDMNGTENPGVFTPIKYLDIFQDYNKIIDEIKDSCPNVGTFFATLFDDVYEARRNTLISQNIDPNSETKEKTLISFCEHMFDGTSILDAKIDHDILFVGINQYSTSKAKQFLDEYDARKAESNLAISILNKRIPKFWNFAKINYTRAGIENGSRIDSRNSALSTVAELLGVPEVICKAVPMKIKNGNEEIEGTFMNLARGVDLNSPTEDSRFYTNKTFKNTNGLKSIADLQIVDFICGNVDRHKANMFYKFDTSDPDPTKHRFIGVEGIDNDTSFGEYVPKNSKDYRLQFCPLDDLEYISESMAKKISVLKPEMLSLTLRNQGLSEDQIKSACMRLDKLKQYLNESVQTYANSRDPKIKNDPDAVIRGTIRVVKDDEFCKLNITKHIGMNNRNYFYKVNEFRRSIYNSYEFNGTLKPEKLKDKQILKMDDKEISRVNRWITQLNNKTQLGRSSDFYRAMQSTAKEYSKFCDNNKGKIMNEEMLMRRDSYLKKIQGAVADYLDHKKDVKEPSKYTQDRIDLAKSLAQEIEAARKEDYYGDLEKSMTKEDYRRFADGMHAYADQELEDFNARMREMALKIQAEHENKEYNVNSPDKDMSEISLDIASTIISENEEISLFK